MNYLWILCLWCILTIAQVRDRLKIIACSNTYGIGWRQSGTSGTAFSASVIVRACTLHQVSLRQLVQVALMISGTPSQIRLNQAATALSQTRQEVLWCRMCHRALRLAGLACAIGKVK